MTKINKLLLNYPETFQTVDYKNYIKCLYFIHGSRNIVKNTDRYINIEKRLLCIKNT